MDVNTLREQQSGVCCKHGRAHFEGKPWLHPQTARRLSCDASLVTVLEDNAGKVLNVAGRCESAMACAAIPSVTRRSMSMHIIFSTGPTAEKPALITW